MLNVIIELNKEDKTFDVKWVLDKKGILEVGINYCPCCYYRLNSNKNKVIELMDALFKEEAPTIPDNEKVIKNMLGDYYTSLQAGMLDFNIVVSKEIIDNRIPLKGITLKEKHVIIEELPNKDLDKKNKELLNEIREAFSGKPKDSNAEYQSVDSDKVKDVSMDEFKPGTFKKMFEIMTTKVKLTRQDLFNKDGSRKPIDEVYEIVQSKKDIENKTKEFVKDNKIDVEKLLKEVFGQPLSEKSRRGNYSRGVEIGKGGNVEPILDRIKRNDDLVKNSKPKNESISEELDKLIKFMQTPNPAFERFKAVNELLGTLNVLEKSNNDVDELLEEVFGKSIKLDKTEMLKKIMDHCRKMCDGTEAIGKPIKDVETNYRSKINQIGTTLERVKKIATYDLSVNNEPTFSLKIGKDIFLFNSIEAYFRDGFGKFHNYYLYIDQNGMMQSNISIKEFELFLLSNSFYNIIDFDQQRYLINTSPSMPGTIRFNSDIILLRECKDFHRDFPRVEKLGFVKGIEKFDRLISPNYYRELIVKPNYYRELIVKKGVEKRYSSLLGENKEQNNNDASFIQNICYVDFVKNHLFTFSFTFSSNKIEGQELYRISLANDMNLLIDTENYLFNHIGSGKDPSTIFVLTKTACDALKTQIQFQDRGEIKFEICDEICEFIGVGNISPKVNVSQKTFDNNNLSIASENGNPIVYFDVYEDDVKKVLKAFNELSNEAEKLYTLDGSISKDNLAVIHKLNAVVNKEIPNVQYFITEKGKKFLEDTNHHVKLNFDLVRDYTTDNINVNDKEFLYLSVYQNKLKVSLGTNLNQQSKKILYKISDKNDTLSIKSLSSWISAMYQGEDKEYGYKDILITASALKKLRQEEVFEEMNFEEVEEVK